VSTADAGLHVAGPGGPFAVLVPRALGVLNAWRFASRRLRAIFIFFLLVSVLFWVGLFGGLTWVIEGFLNVEVFGPLLVRKLLQILLVSLFIMLCFSNVVTSLSTFYLSEDLELLLSLPFSRATLYYNRLLETLLQSSWILLLFGLPLFLAYGVAFHARLAYDALLIVVIPAFVLIPAGLGVAISTVLVNVFPARRTREFMAVIGILAVVGLFVLLRIVRPERLVDAQGFESLAAYVAEIQAPAPVLFPPRWASDSLLSVLEGKAIPWISVGLLVSGALGVNALCRWFTSLFYTSGWARSQDARAARGAKSGLFQAAIRGFTRWLPRSMRPVIIKDLRSFFRDPAQWSQLFLLASLIVIYLFSVRALPVDQFYGVYVLAVKRGIAFLNLGMAGFVMAGVAIRFQFASVSAEGRAFWIARSTPIKAESYLWAKSLVGLIPMLVVGEILAVASSHILRAGPFLTWVCAGTAFGLAWAMSGLGVAFGAVYPNFKADNAARAAASPAGALFMVIALCVAATVLAFEALPVYLWITAGVDKTPVTGWRWAGVVLPLLAAAIFCAQLAVRPIRFAAHRLWESGL
jgi:ABC-2 type transport system permease protein